MMDLIILAGGIGSRLKSVSKGVPKPLMPLGNNKFIDLLLDLVSKNNIKRIYFSLCYKPETFLEYFKSSKFRDIITPIIEPMPMGTGGAIKHVIENTDINNNFFVINGDTLSNTNLDQMWSDFDIDKYEAMIAITYVKNAYRFGTVAYSNDCLTKFCEKSTKGEGWINNGTYLLTKNLFAGAKNIFSLEKELFPQLVNKKKLGVFKVEEDEFIDIGIPEDYQLLCNKYYE